MLSAHRINQSRLTAATFKLSLALNQLRLSRLLLAKGEEAHFIYLAGKHLRLLLKSGDLRPRIFQLLNFCFKSINFLLFFIFCGQTSNSVIELPQLLLEFRYPCG